MATFAGVGISKNSEAFEAGYEASVFALEKLQNRKASFILVFFTINYDQDQVLKGIEEAAKDIPLFGCSTGGVITGDGVASKCVGVMAIQSDDMTFLPVMQKIEESAIDAGKTLSRVIKNNKDLSLLFLFPNVLLGSGSDMLRGAQDELGFSMPIFGGAVSDDFSFKTAYHFIKNESSSQTIGGIGISGKVLIGAGVDHGWLPVGIPLKVTKSSGNMVYTLDDRPAVSIYEEYFGKNLEELKQDMLAKTAFTYPLAFKSSSSPEYIIRSPISVDKNGALKFTAEIPEGSDIRLMIGTKEKAIEAAKNAAEKVLHTFEIFNRKPSFLLLFSCMAREKLFGNGSKDEVNEIRKIIGGDVPLLGFYDYGGIAPISHESFTKGSVFQNAVTILVGIG